MIGHRQPPKVRMPQDDMAAGLVIDFKAEPLKRPNGV
jgi:hypothetical protein